MVILLGNRVLCCEPELLPAIQRISKAASCKAFNRCRDIMLSLDDTRPLKIKNRFLHLRAVLGGKDKLCLSGARYFHLDIFINIAVSMPCNGNRHFPVFYAWLDALYLNRGTEYRTVQYGPDCAVRAFPHFL